MHLNCSLELARAEVFKGDSGECGMFASHEGVQEEEGKENVGSKVFMLPIVMFKVALTG